MINQLPGGSLLPRSFPSATNQTSINVTFEAADAGSGLANITCRFRELNPAQSNSSSSGQAAAESASEWRPCTSPQQYAGLQEGRYGLTLRAADRAGLVKQVRLGCKGLWSYRTSHGCKHLKSGSLRAALPFPWTGLLLSALPCPATGSYTCLSSPVHLAACTPPCLPAWSQTDEFDVFVDFTAPRVSTASLPPL